MRCCGSDLKKKKVGTTPFLFLYISGELTDSLDSLLLNLFICFFFFLQERQGFKLKRQKEAQPFHGKTCAGELHNSSPPPFPRTTPTFSEGHIQVIEESP